MTEFGYFLSGEELAPDELVRAGQAAVDAGFDRLWISDHYHPWLREQGESPFVWSVLAALAATTDAHLTTAVTCPTDRIHPAVIAQAAATTAVLAPGRFSLGVGTGERLNEHILGGTWPPPAVRQERLAEAVAVIRQLWTGDTVTHRGTHYTVDAARIFSLPDQLPPILVSGFGPAATKLAAEIGDGWINVQPDGDLLATYRSAGGTGVTQGGMKICWAASFDDAVATAFRRWGFEGIGGQSAQELPSWLQFESLAEASSPEQVAEQVPCGPDPGRAADQVRKYIEAGFDEVYISQMGPDQVGGIRFIAEQVLPLVR